MSPAIILHTQMLTTSHLPVVLMTVRFAAVMNILIMTNSPLEQTEQSSPKNKRAKKEPMVMTTKTSLLEHTEEQTSPKNKRVQKKTQLQI